MKHKVERVTNKAAAEEAVRTAVAAFSADPDTQRLHLPARTVEAIFSMPVRVGLRLGEVYATEGGSAAVMVMLTGERSRFGLGDLLKSVPMSNLLRMLPAIFNRELRAAMTLMSENHKQLDIGPFWYLMVLGTRPEHQGKGHGSALLESLCTRADSDQRAVYLETQNEANVRLYERFGFVVKAHHEIIPGVQMWEMVRGASL